MEGIFGGLLGSFNPFDQDTAGRHYEQVYQQPHHEASLGHEGLLCLLLDLARTVHHMSSL